MNRRVSLAALVVLVLIVGGCGTARQEVRINYAARGGGPVSAAKPHTLVIVVEDQRSNAEREFVSKVRMDFQDLEYVSTEPVPSVVKNAVKAELERSGHRVLAEANEDADIRVTLSLKRFIAFHSGVGKSAEISAEVSTRSRGKTTTSAPFQVSGTYQWKPNKVLDAAKPDPQVPLNNALAEFVHNLMFDPRFVEAMGP